MEITADNFIKCWKAFVAEKKPEILEVYDRPAERTKLVIGLKNSSPGKSLLGNFMKGFFRGNFDYRNEDGSVDLSFYKTDYLTNVQDMHIETKVQGLNDDILKKYPKYYDVLIEHENVIERAYEEMHKLTYFNSKLKVLITYIWDVGNKGERWEYAHERLCQNFESIIKQANSRYPENGENTYLLITCQRIDGELYFKFSSFDTFSMIKQQFVVVGRTSIWGDFKV